ncbi:GMC family oxidoreductase [Bdellovibrionota bacterium FG-1]
MYDFAVIGSGVSGGRVAHELVFGGAKCLLIEAGREYSAHTFPSNEMDYSTQMFWGGGLEVSVRGDLGFLRAKCLGGTSIVNQALLDPFDDIAWDDWKARSGISFLNRAEMTPYYDLSSRAILQSSIPVEFYNKNAKIFTKALDQLGRKWKPLNRAQGDCKLDKGTDCIVCLGGCPRDSKQSSLVTTIRKAREKGLEVESDFDVQTVIHERDQVRIIGLQRGVHKELVVRKVVLAAGAVGNTAILLRSGLGKQLPALGTQFSCHPQFMSYGVFAERVDAHKGAFQCVKSDEPSYRQKGFKLENVFAPPVATAIIMPGYGRQQMAQMKKYRHIASMEVAVRDEPLGRITMSKCGKLKVDKPLTQQDRNRIKAGRGEIRELFLAVGAKEVIECDQGFGLHLMGGCVMGTDSARSVVSPEFKVHGLPNLFAADSSVFPSAPGINPSFTIMALSQKASESMLAR